VAALNLSFHHFGLAVRQPAPAISFLSSLGYEMGEPVYDPEQNVHLIMGSHPTQPAVEIIYPGNGPGPVDHLVQRHETGIIYHSCYETSDLTRTLEEMAQCGVRADCVVAPRPALLFGGRRVSFYRLKGMGLIEILE
jgi:hypothetical protein